jgi:hypothetical protein
MPNLAEIETNRITLHAGKTVKTQGFLMSRINYTKQEGKRGLLKARGANMAY